LRNAFKFLSEEFYLGSQEICCYYFKVRRAACVSVRCIYTSCIHRACRL